MPPIFPPLDEQEFDAPGWFLHNVPEDPHLNSRSILYYFYASPFFDPVSNNMTLLDRKHTMPDHEALTWDRHYFQNALLTLFQTGVHFIVTSEPEAEGMPWVIQRQNRRHVLDKDENPTGAIETVVEGTYYTVGTKICMAPSLLDVMRSRLLSATHRIQEVVDLSRDLDQWAPATGHTYQLSSYKPAKAKGGGSMSRLGTPAPSELDLSQTQTSIAQTAAQHTEQPTTEFNDNFFLNSLQLTMKYGSEYMDENPLLGEPGAFVFSSSKQQVEAQNKARAEAQAAAPALTAAPAKPIEGATPISSVAPTPKPPTEGGSRKGSVAVKAVPGKEKRRKSKGGLLSPTSPTAPSAL